MLKTLNKIFLVITILTMFMLLGAYLSPYFDPNLFILPSLLELLYPYLFIVNICLLLYWLVSWKRIVWINILVLILGYPSIKTYYGLTNKNDSKINSNLCILSYNVRYFNAYSWSKDKDTKQNIFNYLNNHESNIICLQEFSLKTNSPEEKSNIHKLNNNFKYYYVHDNTAIFSKIPIIRRGYLNFSNNKSGTCLYCDIKTDSDTIRIYSVHLASYKFDKQDQHFLKKLKEGIKNVHLSNNIHNIFSRIIMAHKSRGTQANELHEHISKSPYPVIVCGDFNSTPLSFVYRRITTGIKDAFLECGQGLGNTYIGELPSYRIDYILHSSELKAIAYKKDNIKLSDHDPIYTYFTLK